MPLCKNYGKCEKIEILNLTTERRRNYLVSEPNYQSTKFFTENLLAIQMKNNSNKKTDIYE